MKENINMNTLTKAEKEVMVFHVSIFVDVLVQLQYFSIQPMYLKYWDGIAV